MQHDCGAWRHAVCARVSSDTCMPHLGSCVHMMWHSSPVSVLVSVAAFRIWFLVTPAAPPEAFKESPGSPSLVRACSSRFISSWILHKVRRESIRTPSCADRARITSVHVRLYLFLCQAQYCWLRGLPTVKGTSTLSQQCWNLGCPSDSI